MSDAEVDAAIEAALLAAGYRAYVTAQQSLGGANRWLEDRVIYRAAMRDAVERCMKQCDEWARICDSGKRHGAKVGAQECAKLIRLNVLQPIKEAQMRKP